MWWWRNDREGRRKITAGYQGLAQGLKVKRGEKRDVVLEESRKPLLLLYFIKSSHVRRITQPHWRRPLCVTACQAPACLLPATITTSLHRRLGLGLSVPWKAGEMHSARQGSVSLLPCNYTCENAPVEKTSLEDPLLGGRCSCVQVVPALLGESCRGVVLPSQGLISYGGD